MTGTLMKLMPKICAWLDANGIRSADVPITEVPKIADGKITVRLYRRPRSVVDDRVVDEVRTVPLAVQPPPELRPWLAGRVKP